MKRLKKEVNDLSLHNSMLREQISRLERENVQLKMEIEERNDHPGISPAAEMANAILNPSSIPVSGYIPQNSSNVVQRRTLDTLESLQHCKEKLKNEVGKAGYKTESQGNFLGESSDIPEGMGLRTGSKVSSEELELMKNLELVNVDMDAGSWRNSKNAEFEKLRKIFGKKSHVSLTITEPSKIKKLSENQRRNLLVTGAYMQDSCQVVKFVEGKEIERMLDGKEVDLNNFIRDTEIRHMCSSCTKCKDGEVRVEPEDMGKLRSTTKSMRKEK